MMDILNVCASNSTMTRIVFAGAHTGSARKNRQGFAAASASPSATAAVANHRVDGAPGGAGTTDRSLANEWARIWSCSRNVCPSSAPCDSNATPTTSPAYRHENF